MPNYLSTISAPDANLAAADMTSNFHNFEAAMLNVVMNNQPGMMYWNGGDGDPLDWQKSSQKAKIYHIINSMRKAEFAGIGYIDLDEMFYNIPNVTFSYDLISKTIVIQGVKMTVHIHGAIYTEGRIINLNRCDAKSTGPFNGIEVNGVRKYGYYETYQFSRTILGRQKGMNDIISLWISVPREHRDTISKYIKP